MEKRKIDLLVTVVLFHNKRDQILRLINSLNSIQFDFVLVAVDNSNNRALEALFDGPNHVYLKMTCNLGFGAGHNEGFRYGRKYNPAFYCIMNPDVYFFSDPFLKLTNFLNDNSNLGLCGPKVLYDNNQIQNTCRRLPSPISMILRRVPGIKNLINKKEEIILKDDVLFNIPFILGCFMVLPTKVFKDIGGFDDRFFMYMEDVDLCRKVFDSGYKTAYLPSVEIKHSYAKGSQKNIKLLKFHLESMLKYFNKWGWIIDTKRRKINSGLKS